MDNKVEIPRKAIYRLSIYSRCLKRLLENGIETVSSSALASAAGVKPAQLRKDLAYFGQFGTRGLGYPVEVLLNTIREVLGRAKLQPVVLVGAGNLGRALLRYDGFRKEGFEVLAAFDAKPDEIDESRIPVPVYSDDGLEDFIKENKVRMAIVCVPAEHGQAVANKLVDAGVQAILNFSPIVLQVPEHVVVTRVDLAIELENLSFFIDRD
ncbi:redox-sensing transcriptional repressor [Rubritalea squalenifaciens DSM 18772]|uniref:Redox-sensing transcriptional repressor Rex n=1 Tax=Rubritalea squalenifaciens DSM 18772 TaxID=1123071 RepID=A0A1M6GL58_9BACT|nr:redox-sensing transcriptional repressor [Rubritalea squalenifaciens DSM 18772]